MQIVATAAKEVGVSEHPLGSNDGPRVRVYQSATGAYRVPWCASFVQWCLKQNGIGPVANATASAYYMGDYARAHGWTRPQPAPGFIVVYHEGQGHVGIVEKLAGGGDFYAIEGNESNGVRRVRRHRSEVYCYFDPPGEKPKPRKMRVPRFEVVTSAGGHAVVRVVWGKWSKVGPQIPDVLAKYRTARVLRKVVTR